MGQSIPKMIRIAQELYDSERYLESIEFYEKIVSIDKSNFYAKHQLGLAQMNSLQYESAQRTFSKIAENPDNDFRASAFYHYGSILKLQSKYDFADSLFAQVISVPNADPDLITLARKQKAGCQLALGQQLKDRGFRVDPMEGVNSKFHDFGATANNRTRQLVFATTRTISGEQYQGSQYRGLLPDLVAFRYAGNDRWRNQTSFQNFDRVNSQWSEGAGSFTPDGNLFYFSSCQGEGGSQCSILVSAFREGKWSEPKALNEYINEKNSENKQPSISATGDTLFFVSDRIGGLGGSDIWMSLKGLEEESWGPAINLGEVINTVENEISPYYSSAHESLVFSSNGQVSYGGYDLYLAKGESFFEPEIYNLGDPFNTAGDDLYFNIADSAGFLTSNRVDRGVLDLYYFRVPNERLFLSLLISGETLIDARIASRFIDVASLDLYTFRAEDYEGYAVFDPVKREKPKPKVIAEEEGEDTAAPLLAEATSSTNLTPANQLFEIASRPVRGVPYESIYFAFGSAFLDSKAMESLNQLIVQLENQTTASISVLAFTDPLGSSDFNLDLSARRGKSVKDFLVKKGLDSTKINVLARGEIPTPPQRDSWFNRIFQRRVEIVVESNEPLSLKRARYFALRAPMNTEDIAQMLRIESSAFREWNNTNQNDWKTGDLIRIHFPAMASPDLRFFTGKNDIDSKFFVHKVKTGETPLTIAQKYGQPEELIYESNNLQGPLKTGDEVLIIRN